MNDTEEPAFECYREAAQRLRELAEQTPVRDIQADLISLAAYFDRKAAHFAGGRFGRCCRHLVPSQLLPSIIAPARRSTRRCQEFATDSLLEGTGFEPPVPLGSRLRTCSLQRYVSDEPQQSFPQQRERGHATPGGGVARSKIN
jgi:hypothetical protein